MTAFISHHPEPTQEAGSRALYAAAIGGVLLILGIVLGSIA